MNSYKILKELKVLLVEDEKNLSSLLKNAIGDSFHSFIIASNGKDGLDKFHKYSPDIVISDIMMPEMTGLDMAKEIKNLDENIPIIILSAFSDTDKFLNAIDIGVIKYFIKPFDPDELLEYIESISSKFENKIISLVDKFEFNKITNSLYQNGKYISITKRESLCLKLLITDKEETISDQYLKSNLWKDEIVSDERLRTFIKRFRGKTSKNLIENIKGQGYKIIRDCK